MEEFNLDELPEIKDDSEKNADFESFNLDDLPEIKDESDDSESVNLNDLPEIKGETTNDEPVTISPGLMSSGGSMLVNHKKADNGKVERSMAEQMRLKWQAETGQKDGAGKFIASGVIPFLGGKVKEFEMDKLTRMYNLSQGKPSKKEQAYTISSYAPGGVSLTTTYEAKSLNDAWINEARNIGMDEKHLQQKEGESDEDFRSRIQGVAGELLKERLDNIKQAQIEIKNTDETIADKIVVGGMPSLGYAGEMAVGGLMFKGAQGIKLGFDLLSKEGIKQLLTKEGAKQFGKYAGKKIALDSAKAMPATVAGTERGVRELSRDDYGFDDNGNVIVTAEGDKGNVVGKALLNSYTENLLENLVGEVTRPVAGKIFGAIGKTGKVGKFVNDAYQNYNKLCEITSFGDIFFEELPEENVQYFFSDILGWGKKDSEYGGFYKELGTAFKDGGQYSAEGQWNTILAMLMQMGIQASYAGAKTGKQYIDAKRDIGNQLEGICGLTKEQVSNMSLNGRITFANLWNKFQDNPAAFEDALKKAGVFIGENANELMKQSTYKTENSIREYGETPRGFKLQYETGADGKQYPKFEQGISFNPLTGESSVNNVMRDPDSGVSIADNGDGTYAVSDGIREGHSFETDNFDDAKRIANFFALKAQRNRLDNDRKREYAKQLLSTKFKRNAIVADHVADIYRMFKNGIETDGEFRGVKDLSQLFKTDENGNVKYPPELKGGNLTGGFALPDGSIVAILDNITGPQDMVRVLSHESGHASGYEDEGKRLSFLKKADPNSEYGKVLANLRARNEEQGLGRSEDYLLGEAFSVWLQKRGHNPTIMQKLHNMTFGKLGKVGDAELEVLANQIERESESGEGHSRNVNDRVSFVSGVSFGENDAGVDDTVPQEARETPQDAPAEVPSNNPPPAPPSAPGVAPDADEDIPPATVTEDPLEDDNGPLPSFEMPDEETSDAKREQKPVSERTIIEKLTDEVKPDEVAIDEIEVSDSRIPQFKEGADPTTGEVEPLTGEPYDLVSNPIVVMEFKDGKKVVVTGRHRYGLYKRSGRKTISARVIREEDGWTVDDAMAIDAIGNIIDEKGTEKDYVRYFDNAKPTREEAKAAGFLDREKGKRAFSIFEGATEDTKELIDWEGSGSDGKISVAQAGIIAEAAPKDANPRFAAVQHVLVKKALAGVGGKKLGVLARSLAEEAKNRTDAPKVEGGTQLDLFTSEDDLALLALEEKRADYRTKKSSDYDRIAGVLRTAIRKGGKLDLNEEFAQELGIADTKDKKQLNDAWTKAKERANYWESAPTLDEADKTAMDAEINAKAEAAAKKLADAKAKREAKIAGNKPEAKPEKPAENPKSIKVDESTEKLRAHLRIGGIIENGLAFSISGNRDGTYVARVDVDEKPIRDTRGTPIFNAQNSIYKSKPYNTRDEAVEDLIAVIKNNKFDVNPPASPQNFMRENILSGDDVRATMPGYVPGDWHTHIDRTGYVAERMNRRFEQLLETRRGKGERSNKGRVIFLAGGNGAGKSTVSNDIQDAPDFTIDSTLGNLSVAREQIRRILDNGQLPHIYFVYRTPEQALVNIQKRIDAGGHTVSPLSFANSHVDSLKNLPLLVEEFNDKLSISIFDFSSGEQKKITLDELKKKGIPDHGEIRAKANLLRPLAGSGEASARSGVRIGENGIRESGSDARGATGEQRAVNRSSRVPKTIVMKNAAEEAKAAKLLNDIDFDDTALSGKVSNAYSNWLDKFRLGHTDKRLKEWKKIRRPIDFDDTAFDYEKFGKLVSGVGKLVDVMMANGHNSFDALATYIAEHDAAKYERAKAVLQDEWNAVARQKNLARVSDDDANKIYDKIDAKLKEVSNGRADSDNQRHNEGDGGSLGGVLPNDVASSSEGKEVRGTGVRGVEESVGATLPGTGGGQGRTLGGDRGGRDSTRRGRDRGGRSGQSSADSGTNIGFDRPAVSAGQGEVQGEQRPSGNGVGVGTQGNASGLDTGRPEYGVGGGTSEGHSSAPSPSVRNAAKKAANKATQEFTDFVITPSVEEAILERNQIKRVRNNIAALKLLQKLKERDFKATPEEQNILAKYVGWGGLSEIFSYEYDRAYDFEKRGDAEIARKYALKGKYGLDGYEAYKELRQTLNDEEYRAANATVLTAFYTPIEMVRIEHDALRRLGVLGGRFLGPSAGVGNYASAAGLYEKDVAWQFVEKDIVSGQILKALFPNQRVHIGGYEETKFADSFFDFAIDNVPYGDINITDKSLMKEPLKIHDYFFAKTLSKLRPGGVMMFLTSTGTLDKTDGKLRQFLSKKGGKIIGAVRLPNGFFSKNAGTDVASDLVIIQRQEGEADNSAFMQSHKYGEGSEYVRRKGSVKVDLTYNKYFADHPEQIIGEMKVGSGQYGRTMLEYKMPKDGMFDLVRAAIDRALEGVDKDALMKSAPKAVQKDHTPIYHSEGLRQGNITVKDGVVYENSGDELVPVKISLDQKSKKAIAIKGLTPTKVVEKIIEVRKALRDVVDAEVKGVNDETLQPLLDKLNAVYDAFVKKCGTFHEKAITPLVMLDKADGNRLMSLENLKKVNGEDVLGKADIFSKRVIFTHARPTHADTIDDALVIAYSETASVDVNRIGELLGVSREEAEKHLKESGMVFENPQTGKIEPYWEYLSGHVRRKLEAARAATANDQAFQKNMEELEKVQPEEVPLDKVNIKFGATWVDAEAMTDFIREVYDLGEYAKVKVEYNETTGKWYIEIPRSDVEPFGATTFSQEHFLSAILNHQSLDVKEKDEVTGKYYLLEKETEAQKLAAEKLNEAFARFLRTSEKWFEPSQKSFNYIMNDNVPMILPKNILPLRPAGMSEDAIKKISAEGREYQPDVIARGVMGGKSLCLAHCVGAGKTLEMQTIGMVGRHLGMFKKPMYVVPNHMLDQFCNEFLSAFPNANLLKMTTDDVKPENRRAFFAKVANGDWDAIIVKHSTYSKKLPMTKEWQKQYLGSQVQKLTDAKLAASSDKNTAKDIQKIITKVEARIDKLDNSQEKDDQIVPFEELGVDQLFIDEAHNFKGLPIVSSQARNVKGLDQGDSQRALDMEMKALYVQSLHGGKRGVVFATGTPLSNAPVVEAYVMLRYLAPYALEEQGIKHFDDFVNTFGNITTESEFSIDGKSTKEVSRVTSFVNIPEMMRLFKSIVDIVNSDQIKVKRPAQKLIPVPVAMDDAQAKIMKMVADESAIPASKEEKGKFLTLSGIAKRACISPRLVGIDSDGYKLAKCAEVVKRKYDETSDVRGAQLVFTDIFNSSDAQGVQRYVGAIEDIDHISSSWNLNKHLKELLVKSGIPAEQIAIIQDVDRISDDEEKSAAKEALFAKVRSGEVRVLIGSRPRMGEGTNVQERLAAIHLLHPGWKPAEDTQAIGRIIRPGNMFETGEVYYYLTQGNDEVGSYETKNHELIAVKDRLIQAIMHGDESIREIDLDTETAERDMLMGLASANEDLIKLIDVRRVLHKAELNIESVLFSARSNEDNASRTERQLARMKENFAEQEKGAKEWRKKNPDKSFVLTTADGRKLEKVSEMADYVSGEVTKQLAKDRYDREDTLEIGNFNGVPLNINYAYHDNKFYISVPSIGYSREVIYSGFIPDFTTMAMTAFKTRILNDTADDIESVHAQQIKDAEKRIKRLRDDAKRFTEEYNKDKEKLIALRKERERLERAVTPLIVQTTEDHKYSVYGNWYISKIQGGYRAVRGSDQEELVAKTVKALIPMMDDSDFSKPGSGANKTVELRQKLEKRGVDANVESVKPKDVDFDDKALSDAAAFIFFDDTQLSVRTAPPPKVTGIGYKVFVQKNGKLYPPMVANPGGADTPVGVWLDAAAAPISGMSKTGRPQVKQGGKGTQGGSGRLAYRPGWHLGTIPFALQFNRADSDGNKTLFPKNFVWAEVEYARDIDYQAEAEKEGMTENGKFRHSYAGLKRLPADGYYMYRTNPNPETDPWIITGSMKVNRILTKMEVDDLVRSAGREPQMVEFDDKAFENDPNSPNSPLSDAKKNAIIKSNRTRKIILDGIINGRIKYPRFTPEEVKASYGEEHEQLWDFILYLENAKLHRRRVGSEQNSSFGEVKQNSSSIRSISELGTRIGWDPRQRFGGTLRVDNEILKFLGSGAQSFVYVTEKNRVRKFKEIHPYDENSIIDELSSLVYHNYLFPKDSYKLNDILRYEKDGYKSYFLDIEQELVIPQKDSEGYTIQPSYGQIIEALNKSPLSFALHTEYQSNNVDSFDSSNDYDSDSEVVPAAKQIAYNGQFFIYDFKPGENTFLDSTTGEIRFIDPRIEINVPGEPFSVSKFGKRKKYDGFLDKIDFDDTSLRPDPTPEEVDKLVGITNEDIDLRTRALGLKPSVHEVVGFDHMHKQAEILLSNPEYMQKLIRAVYKWNNGGRGVAPHENLAIGQYITALSNEIEADKEYLDEIKGMIDSGDITDEETINDYKRERAKFDKKLALRAMTEVAKKKGVGNAARTLLSNRDMLRPDLTFAGIVSRLSEAAGLSVENGIQLPPEMIEVASELSKKFKELSEEEYAFYARRWREYSKKVFADHAKKVKARVATANSNEMATVTRNYLDAMTQIEVAANNGDVDLLGLQDNTIPGFGKWLKAIAEYHIMTNPDIMADLETAEEKVVAAIVEDVQTFLPEVTADAVRRAYTGYGHHFKQSNRETQAIMNDLRGQSLSKLQLKTMQEENKLPPVTGMERDEPSDVRRRLMKDVYEAKKMTPEGAANSLKGVLQSAKKALDNRIKDLQHAIETGVALPKRERRVWDDVEIIKKRVELEELKKKYDEIFKTTRVLTDEERVKMAENALGRALEKLTNEVVAARQGMFKNEQRRTVTSSTLEVLRQKANEIRKELLDLKKAAYYHGKTPAEIIALNRRKIENLRKLIEKKADWVRDGKRPAKANPLPMTPKQKAEYERLAKANRDANEKLRQMEEDARRMTWVAPLRIALDTWNFFAGTITSVAASYDRSAVLRQTLKLSLAHPLMALKNYGTAEKAAWNAEYFDRVNESIENDPIIKEAIDKFGLKIRSSDIANIHDVEQFAIKRTLSPQYIKRMGDLLGSIPGVGYAGRTVKDLNEKVIVNAERHYITYINLMAAQQYKLFCDAVPGGTSDFEKRKFAGIVNILTGAGAAPAVVRSAINKINTLNGNIQNIIWSPSLMMSQIQQFLYADVWGSFIGHSQDAKENRKERFVVAKEAAKLRVRAELATVFLGMMLYLLWSDDDEWEEFKNADFSKKVEKLYHPIIGKTHIDLESGARSFNKISSQLFSAEYETATGRKMKASDFNYRDIYSSFGRYFGSKLTPPISRIVSILQGYDFVGKPYGAKEAAIDLFPLSLGDIYDSAVQDEWMNGQAPVAIALTLLGAGGNVYDEKYYERAVNPVKGLIREYDRILKDETIEDGEREKLLNDMIKEHPILSYGNRFEFSLMSKRISKNSRMARDHEMRDGKPDEKILEEIDKEKDELIKFIRKVNSKK